MKTLTLYLAGGVSKRGLVVLLLLTVVYASIDLVEAGSLPGAPQFGLWRWYPFKLPQAITQLLPLALVIGVELELAGLRGRGEWNALLAAGISPLRVTGALLIVPVACCAPAALLSCCLAPSALAVWQGQFATPGPSPSSAHGSSQWFRLNETFVLAGDGEPPGLVVERSSDGRVGSWRATGPPFADRGTTRIWTPDVGWQEEPATRIPLARKPPTLYRTDAETAPVLPGASLTWGELSRQIAGLRRLGHFAAPLEAEHALRIALVIACSVLPFAALGLSIHLKQSSAVWLVTHGVFSGVLFWLLTAAFWNGASRGLVSPVWIYLGAPALFAATGALLTAGTLTGSSLLSRRSPP